MIGSVMGVMKDFQIMEGELEYEAQCSSEEDREPFSEEGAWAAIRFKQDYPSEATLDRVLDLESEYGDTLFLLRRIWGFGEE